MARVSNRVVSVNDRFCYMMARSPVKEACAEFLATFVLVMLGDGVMASCILGRMNLNSVLVGAFGWGFAVMIAVSIAGGVSGGHVNPAVTIGLVSVKKCPLKHAMPYLAAQYIGSFLAAAVVYVTYADAINLYDGGFRQVPPYLNSTAEIFSTYSQEFASTLTCFLDQVIGTTLFLIVICAATDSKNLRVPPHAQPLMIGLGITAIILAFGHNCGAPLNPARDFAPRLFTAVSGWGKAVFSYRNYGWFWIPILGPHVGGIIGAWLYKGLIEMPFTNYSRLLEETESADHTDGEKRGIEGFEAYMSGSAIENICPDDSVYKHVLGTVARKMPVTVDTVSVDLNRPDMTAIQNTEP